MPAPIVLTLPVGVNLSEARAVLMAALLPVKTIFGSVVPSPVVKVRPVVVVSVIVPLGDAPRSSVTFSSAPKSSVSVNETPAKAALMASSLTVRLAGAANTGASLTLETLILKVAVLVLLPSTPVRPSLPLPTPENRSSTVVVTTTVPFELELPGV